MSVFGKGLELSNILKPCICGGIPKLHGAFLAAYSNPAPFYVKCSKCGKKNLNPNIYYATPEEAIDNWNEEVKKLKSNEAVNNAI